MVVPQIYLGPPGTGKTTTLLNIVAAELEAGVEPHRIGYVSFTRRAAYEAVDRAVDKFAERGLKRADFPFFSTLHALCYRQLGLSGSQVFGAKEHQEELGKRLGVKITGRVSEDGTLTGFDAGDRMMFIDGLARARRIPLRQQFNMDDDGLSWVKVEQFSNGLRAYKSENGLMDYTDMLEEFVGAGLAVDLDVLVVDEAQDLSKLQWEVVYRLAEGVQRFYIGGDDDQAIYRWSGADSDHLITMPGNVTVLDKSYRVPPVVHDEALKLVPHMGQRREKQWSAREVKGDDSTAVERRYDLAEADLSRKRSLEDDAKEAVPEYLILARNSYILRQFVEPHLRRLGVIWERATGPNWSPSIRQAYLEAIRTWEQLRRVPKEGEPEPSVSRKAALSVYEWMLVDKEVKRGHKSLPELKGDEDRRVTLSQLKSEGGLLLDISERDGRRGPVWFETLGRLPQGEVEYIRSALRSEENLQRPRVRISTIHGAKGSEADRVVVMTEMAWRSFNEMRIAGEQGRRDEARVWYVAVTRARKHLTIVGSRSQNKCPWL